MVIPKRPSFLHCRYNLLDSIIKNIKTISRNVTIFWAQPFLAGFQLFSHAVCIFTCLLKQWLRVILLKREAEIQYSTTEVSVIEREWIKVDMALYLGQFLIEISNGTFEILT